MAKVSLKTLSKKMRKLDFCMMSTISTGQTIASRPMSNNGNVEYDGTSFYFAWKDSKVVKDIKKNKQVGLEFVGAKRLFIAIEGQAKIVEDAALMQEHWNKSLNYWFKQGPDTEGVVMIQVEAKRIKYWQDDEEGELVRQ